MWIKQKNVDIMVSGLFFMNIPTKIHDEGKKDLS